MEEVEIFASSTDPLLLCIMCKRLLHEAVQLKCLHNCCRKCFNFSASTVGSEGVSCAICEAITESGSEMPNGFLDGQVKRYRAIAASRVCGLCESNDEHDKPALLWCPTCRHSLCDECVVCHRQYFRQHVTKSLEELITLDEVFIQQSTSSCTVHKRVLEIGCRDCQQAKCFTCSADCVDRKHEIYFAGKGPFDTYVGTFISIITSTENELLRKSRVLEEPKSLLQATKEARERHLEEIAMRKRRIVDAVATLYHEIETATKNAYDELEAERDAAAADADVIEANLSDARSYIRRLFESDDKCAIINQQKIVHERLSFLSAELENLSKRLSTTMREVKLESFLPDNVEDIVRAWIGIPGTHAASPSPAPAPALQQPSQQQPQASSSPPSQQKHQNFSFSAPSDTFKLPVSCEDVALTQDGRSLLLAARHHGLIELSSASGRELRRWRPRKNSSGWDDDVWAVAALTDRRAAVSLYCAQLVVLLRRKERNSYSDWTEDRRIQLLWRARCLSAHGDVLAASESFGRRLLLLSMSSGRPLSDTKMQRDYRIGSLAVTARLLVTVSGSKVELGGGRRAAQVLDAHSLDTDGGSCKRLWRHVLQEENEGTLYGVCADSSGGHLYAAVCRSDGSSSRVSALSLADGSELRRVALSFQLIAAAAAQLLLLPVRLSLCDGRAAEQQRSSGGSRRSEGRELLLAALCWNPATGEWRTVTLHHSTSDMLQ